MACCGFRGARIDKTMDARISVRLTFILLLAAAGFAVSTGHGLVWDDWSLTTRPFFLEPVTRPLTEATLWANWQMSEHPAGLHVVNLGLHLAVVWLVFDVLRRCIDGRAALIAAGLFAVHPLQAEAVNYVWARSSLLMALFCLLAVRDWLDQRHWRAVAWFGAGLLAKQECVALPLALLLLPAARHRWKPLAAMAGLSAAMGGYVLWAANTTPGSQAGAHSNYSALEYAARQGDAILHYARSFVLPFGLTPDAALTNFRWWAWLAVAAAVAISFRFGPWVAMALVLLLPSSSIFPANDLAADRRMYLPMVALSAVAGLLLQRIRLRWLAAGAVLLAALSFRQSIFWESEDTLWRYALEGNPNSVIALRNLARWGRKPGDVIPLLERARKIAPDDPAVASALGRAYLNWVGPERALAEFGRALALAPNSPEALNNRGMALLALGQTEVARADFERALRRDPCLFEARLNLRLVTGSLPPAPGCRYVRWQKEALEGKR